ncbi:NDP-sugar synthase [Patescibacteria group bacterium]
MDVIILAGGKGTRMEDPKPKALVEINGKPLLAYQLDYFLNSDVVNQVILALGHRADEIVEYINGNYSEAPIKHTIETEPLGTAGGIKQAMQHTESDKVVVLNCDDLTDIDLETLKQTQENTICVANPQLPFGLVKETNGYACFEEKPTLQEWVSCGWYLFNKHELEKLLPAKGSIEYDVFPKMKLRIYKHTGFWQPLNTKKDLNEFEQRELPDKF